MSTPSPPYFSVIIVGAGPTGLTMGNLLGMYDIDALILEHNAGLSECPKAISLDDEGLRICQAIRLSQHSTNPNLKPRYFTASNVSHVSVYSFSILSKHLNRAIQVLSSPFVLLEAFSKHSNARTC